MRTGTGSLSRSFVGKTVSHEQGMPVLRPAALDLAEGRIDAETFVRITRSRLVHGAAEVDISTVHHLYVSLLAEIWPTTTFVLTMRDVRSWTTSVLGLVQRKNAYLQRRGLELDVVETRYLEHLTGASAQPYAQADHDLAISLMRYWAAHHERLIRDLEPSRIDRRMIVGTSGPREHVSPMPQPDRFMMGDRTRLRQEYESSCAELMAEFFPLEHAQLYHDWEACDEPDWAAHVEALDDWLTLYVVEGTLPPGASAQGWT